MDLISDEIHNIIDSNYDERQLAKNNIEIPIECLMKPVEDITDDVDKIR